MAINSDRIEYKVSDGFTKLLKAGFRGDLLNVQVIPTHSTDKKEVKRVEVRCPSATMELIGVTFTGNYWADVEIGCVTHHNDVTREEAGAMFGQVREIIMVNDLIEQMNALEIPDFSLLGASGQLGTTLNNVRQGFVIDGDANIDLFMFSVYCCPSTLEGFTP